MKEYLLSLKTGEAINTTKSPSLEEAIIYFSEVKKLSTEALLDIYTVTLKEQTTFNLYDYCVAHRIDPYLQTK
jgi:hypothetical protein